MYFIINIVFFQQAVKIFEYKKWVLAEDFMDVRPLRTESKRVTQKLFNEKLRI